MDVVSADDASRLTVLAALLKNKGGITKKRAKEVQGRMNDMDAWLIAGEMIHLTFHTNVYRNAARSYLDRV